MKKLLLTFVTLLAAVGGYAQSLSLVVYDHTTKEELATLNSGDTYDAGDVEYNSDWGMWSTKQIYFYIKNNSSNAGTANFTGAEGLTAAAELCRFSLCEDQCYSGVTAPSDFKIPASGEYRGLNNQTMDFQILTMDNPSGAANFKVSLKFSHDSEPCVFYINTNFNAGTGIESVEALQGLKVAQDASDNIVARYAFDSVADRAVEIYNLAGEVVYRQALAGTNGEQTLSVSLNRGVYLYILKENGKAVKAHKFIVK